MFKTVSHCCVLSPIINMQSLCVHDFPIAFDVIIGGKGQVLVKTFIRMQTCDQNCPPSMDCYFAICL